MIMTVYGKYRVNATPSLVPMAASGAGPVVVPIQIRAAQQGNQPTSMTFQIRRASYDR